MIQHGGFAAFRKCKEIFSENHGILIILPTEYRPEFSRVDIIVIDVHKHVLRHLLPVVFHGQSFRDALRGTIGFQVRSDIGDIEVKAFKINVLSTNVTSRDNGIVGFFLKHFGNLSVRKIDPNQATILRVFRVSDGPLGVSVRVLHFGYFIMYSSVNEHRIVRIKHFIRPN